jgi:hypothetical protein
MIYRLHRYLFKKSSWFFNSIDQPNYFVFTKKDFDRFLSILYPSCVPTHLFTFSCIQLTVCRDYCKHECETAEEWTSVLLVADQGGMQNIRKLAINKLAECAGPVDKITLGHRYNIKEWLGPAYLALAMRKEPLTGEEGRKIGVEALVRIAALKDEVFANLTTYVDQDKFAELFKSKLAM